MSDVGLGGGTTPDDHALQSIREIAASQRVGWVRGMIVDPWTATRVVALHDSFSPLAQEAFRTLPVRRMVEVTYDQEAHRLRGARRR